EHREDRAPRAEADAAHDQSRLVAAAHSRPALATFITEEMTDSPPDPGRRAQLDPVLAGVFGDLDAAALAAITQSVHWVSLPGGATLFRQGDRTDDVFVVVNGRLRTELEDADGTSRVLEEVGRGA